MVENRFRSIWQNRGEDLLAFELERFHIVEYVFAPWHELKLALRLKPSADTYLELGIVEDNWMQSQSEQFWTSIFSGVASSSLGSEDIWR